MSALLPTYARSELSFARGEGAYLFSADGERYLDFASGVAVTALGHAHPQLVAALTEQAKKLWHVSNLHRIPEQERLAARLCAASFVFCAIVLPGSCSFDKRSVAPASKRMKLSN